MAPSPAAPTSSARCSARRRNADAHHITAPAPGGTGRHRVHGAGPARRRAHPRRHPPDQRPRHLHPAERRRRGRGHHHGVRPPGPPVTSTKGVTGHALGAAGALEAAARAASYRARGSSRPRRAPRCSTTAFEIDLVTGAARPWTPGPRCQQPRLRRPQRLDHPRPPPDDAFAAAVRRDPRVPGTCTYGEMRSKPVPRGGRARPRVGVRRGGLGERRSTDTSGAPVACE